MRKLLITLVVVFAVLLGGYFTADYFLSSTTVMALPPPPPPATNIDIQTPIASMKIVADNSLEWMLVLKLLTLVLVSYGGIKFINKKFE